MFISNKQNVPLNPVLNGRSRLFPDQSEQKSKKQPQDIYLQIAEQDSNQRQSENPEKRENNVQNPQSMDVKQIKEDQYQRELKNRKTKKIRKDNTRLLQQKPKKQDDKDENSNSDNSEGSKSSESSQSSEEQSSHSHQNSSNFQSSQSSQRTHPNRFHFSRSDPYSQPSNGRSSPARRSIQSQRTSSASASQQFFSISNNGGLGIIDQGPEYQLPHNTQNIGPSTMPNYGNQFSDFPFNSPVMLPFIQINNNIQPMPPDGSKISVGSSNMRQKSAENNGQRLESSNQQFCQQTHILNEEKSKLLQQEIYNFNLKNQHIQNFIQEIFRYHQERLLKDNYLTEQKNQIAKEFYSTYIKLKKQIFNEEEFQFLKKNWLEFQSADKYFEFSLKQVKKYLLQILPLNPILPLEILQPHYPIFNKGATYLDPQQFFNINQYPQESNQKSKRTFLWELFSGKKEERNSQKQLYFKLKQQFQIVQAFKYYVAGEEAKYQKELNTTEFLRLISNWVKFDEVLETFKGKVKIQMDFKKSKPGDLALKGYEMISSELEKLNRELKMFSLSLSDPAEKWFHTSTMGYLVNCLIDQRSYLYQIEKQAQNKIFGEQKEIFERFLALNKDQNA